MTTSIKTKGYVLPNSSFNSNSDGYDYSRFGSSSFVRTDLGKVSASLPNYKEIIALRQDATLPYQTWSQSFDSKATQASVNYTYPSGSSTGSGRVVFNGYPAAAGFGDYVGPSEPAFPQDSYNKLVVRFLNNIKGSSRVYAGGQDVGELRETIQGIRTPAKSLWDGFSNYLGTVTKRCTGLQKARAIAEVVRDTYLEYAFQWRPLVNSINESGAAMNRRLDLMDLEIFETSAGMQEVVKDEIQHLPYSDPDNGWFRWTVRENIVYVHKFRFYAIVRRDVNRENRFVENLGLAPHDWVATAWQLLPLSFVTDYFVNIGACLSAAGSLDYTFVTGGSSESITGFELFKATPDTAYTNNLFVSAGLTPSIQMHPHEAVLGYKGFWRRWVNPNALWIIPVIQIPHFSSQWINIAALSTALTDVSKSLIGRIRN